jgi:hypothetical protein
MNDTDEGPDLFLAAEIERAVAPYRRLFPEDVIATMEEVLEHALTTHPVGASLLDRVRPRAAPDRSGSQTKDGAPGAVPDKKARSK